MDGPYEWEKSKAVSSILITDKRIRTVNGSGIIATTHREDIAIELVRILNTYPHTLHDINKSTT